MIRYYDFKNTMYNWYNLDDSSDTGNISSSIPNKCQC